jgi:transposase
LEDYDLRRRATPGSDQRAWIIDGPINGELFTIYAEQVLAPTLVKGDIVILDNLGSHKGQAARNAIRARAAHLIFLPPYSPDLNPIEQVFAKLKHPLRDAQPRELEATWRKVGELLDLFSPDEYVILKPAPQGNLLSRSILHLNYHGVIAQT